MNIKDIARICQVSTATVSRVINGKSGVSQEKRQKIQNLVEQYGYFPSPLGRALSCQRSQSIGILLATLDNPFYAEILAGIESVLRKSDYTMLLACSDWKSNIQHQAIQNFEQQQIAGALAVPLDNTLSDFQKLNEEVPLILIDYEPAQKDWNYITTNNFQGGAMVAEYLVQQGHRKIFIVNPHNHQTCQARMEGFLSYMGNDLIQKHVEIEIRYGINTKQLADEFIKKTDFSGYTVLFCVNDIVAIYLIEALEKKGIHVPGDMAVFGYDDVSFAEYYRIPISTISQAKRFMGELAATELLYQLQNSRRDYHLKLQPELVRRKSCP